MNTCNLSSTLPQCFRVNTAANSQPKPSHHALQGTAGASYVNITYQLQQQESTFTEQYHCVDAHREEGGKGKGKRRSGI